MSHVRQACRGWGGDVQRGGERSAESEYAGDSGSLWSHGLQILTLVLLLFTVDSYTACQDCVSVSIKTQFGRPEKSMRMEAKSEKSGRWALHILCSCIFAQFMMSKLKKKLSQTTNHITFYELGNEKTRAVATLVCFVCRQARMQVYVSHETGNT